MSPWHISGARTVSPGLRRRPTRRGRRKSLTPHYDQIDQTSLTAQWTHDAWLVKLDAVRRASQVESFVALVGGIEFAFATYLSVFAEYLHDGRGSGATTSMEHDVFAGTRLLDPRLDDLQPCVRRPAQLEPGAFDDRVP